MLEFLFASSNAHKMHDFQQAFKDSPLRLKLADVSLDIEESGKSFEENALIKAQAYYQKFKKPCMADDSGLVVEKLPEDLGIYSARFGGADLTYLKRMQLLLEKMQNYTLVSERSAFFVCVLCFYLSPQEIFFFEGRLQGSIAFKPEGEFGFGYDPLFVPKDYAQGLTLAQIPDWKNQYSHRAKASKEALQFFCKKEIANIS